MRTARVPMPGIVLGSYPERRDGKTSPAWGLPPLLQGWRLARTRRFVLRVRELEGELRREPPQALSARLSALRARFAHDGFVDAPLAEAFAIVAMACARELGTAPFDTQLMAARIMLDGRLAEMATGEGKTLAAGIAAATAALAGAPVHVVTANDYLVTRDAETLSPLYRALGLTVGAVTQEMDAAARRRAYACDIAYCTARELAFDYLRDGVAEPRRNELEQRAARLAAPASPEKLLRGLCMAIVDEADSILIDEARVPLVLSRAVPVDDGANYRRAWELSARLESGTHFSLDAESRSARLAETGRMRLQMLAAESAWPTPRHREEAVRTALVARHLLRRDRDYLVRGGQVLIIDETTGRTADGRAWSQGLHQMIEIKEGCIPSTQTVPLAQITWQRFFPRYLRLGGMSGTLAESRGELREVYGLDVVPVPLRRPGRRQMLPARVFPNREAQRAAAVERVRELHSQGRPVLVGTDSVAESEALSRRLAAAGIAHALLNASQDRHEAQIIAAAGAAGAVTVATNMAGRGTDIVLGAGVAETGGLHVICCQQNAARRIDRQLVGRCARQGDPGSAEAFIALDGPLLSGNWLARLAIEGGAEWLGALALNLAQRAEERRQRREREALLRQDREMSRWFAFSGPES